MDNSKPNWGGHREATDPDRNRRVLKRVLLDQDTNAIVDMVASANHQSRDGVVKTAIYMAFPEFVRMYQNAQKDAD